MRFGIKQCVITLLSTLVLSSMLYSLSVLPLDNYTDKISTFSGKDAYRMLKCEVVHIGIVCAGYNYTIHFYTMLKSLYFYRNNPIHFHIMVDDLSKKVLQVLFETWDAPQVSVTFYDMKNFIPDVEWVPRSKHYSGKSALLKLMFPKAVLLSVTSKLIILDTDLTFNGDVYELWSLFKNFNQNQAIGLIEHQNDYYLAKLYEKYPWPALGRGFNSGVMLYHLERLKLLDWDNLWTTITEETISTMKIMLPDQDIINTVLNKTPSLLYNVPCQWNIQLTPFSDGYKCYENNKVKIMHWNSPSKENVKGRDTEYFRGFYTMFVNYNGNLLKNQLYNCSVVMKSDVSKHSDVCDKYRTSYMLKRRTLLFIREFKHVPHKNDVTFVSQLTQEKLHLVEELSKRWDGPISFTFYVTDAELQDCLNFIENSEVLRKRSNIAYHAIFKEGDGYPINELRNTGLRNVITSYVFLADIDLVPMKHLYSELQRYIRETDLNNRVLVVPAFESEQVIPPNKRMLLKALDNRVVFPFHYLDAPQGQNQTDYKKWKTAKGPYHVQWAPFYEPYIVAKRNVVEFDRSLVGFGWNKVSHTMELVAQKYKFLVLTNAFVVHKNHAGSNDLNEYKYKDSLQKCGIKNMKIFVERLNQVYEANFDKNMIK